jgi:hypothetical protein
MRLKTPFRLSADISDVYAGRFRARFAFDVADLDRCAQRECIRQYLETALVHKPQCPVCNLPISIDLEQEAIEQDTTGRQGILSRLDPTKARTSTKIEALCVVHC